MSRPLPDQLLHIGDHQLLASLHELRGPGGVVQRLPRRLVLLLLELAAHPGTVVSRDSLLDRVWQRREVSDEVLSRAIADLRQAFADDARAPRYIETIPKTGYRLLARVGSDGTAEPGKSTAGTPAFVESGLPDLELPHRATAASSALRQATPKQRSALAVVVCLALAMVSLIIWLWRPASQPPASAQAARLSAGQLVRATPLSSDADWELNPAISPDGHWLAYARSAPFAQSSELWLRHLQQPIQRVLANEPGWNDSPVFSPDGSELAWRHCAVAANSCELRVMGVDGQPWRALGKVDRAGLDWSTAGILASRELDDAGAGGIMLFDLDSGQWRGLTRPSAASGPDQLPRFVPGSRRVVFARGPAGLQQLHALDLDHPGETTLLSLPGSRIQDHRWLDPEHAVVASDAAGFRALVLLDDEHWSLLGARGTRSLALHPDGGLILEVVEYDSDLWLEDLDNDSAGTRLEISTRFESQPALSPDGRWLALVSLREGRDQIWLRELGGAEGLRRVESPTGAQAVRPVFSADSAHLYFSVYEEDTQSGGEALTATFQYDLMTASLTRLKGLGTAFAVQPGAAGWLVYGEHSPAGLRLFRARPDGSQRQPIRGAGQVAEFRVDGERLCWQSRGIAQLSCSDLTGAALLTLTLPGHFLPSAELSWTLAADSVFAVSADGRLWRHAVAAAAEWTALRQLPQLVGGPALAIDVARNRLVSARMQRISVDLQRVPGP